MGKYSNEIKHYFNVTSFTIRKYDLFYAGRVKKSKLVLKLHILQMLIYKYYQEYQTQKLESYALI